MNTKRAYRLLYSVISRFELTDQLGSELEAVANNERELYRIAELLGITQEQLRSGIAPVPDAVYQQYPLFALLADWNFSKLLTGKYGALRTLGRIFGQKVQDTLPDIPSEKEEEEMLMASVRTRCDRKVHQVNELFPGTYPLGLPVSKFILRTNELITFEKVYEMVDAHDAMVKRFTRLFFAAIQGDLSERDACELNLLATFLEAIDVVPRHEPITYCHIQEHREFMQAEGYTHLESYVRIRREIPFWWAREFYKDAAWVTKYIQEHPETKRKIRSHLHKVTSYECQYVFVQNMAEHQRRSRMSEEDLEEYEIDQLMSDWDDTPSAYTSCEPIFVDKENGEITERDRLIVERGYQLLKGIRVKIPQPEPNARNRVARGLKRQGLPVPDCVDRLFGDHAEDLELDVFAGKEGDCDA